MTQSSILRLAMWSGPRNISTALMRSWGNRPDTFVCDEPLYAHYLKVTGLPHPGADEVIAHHDPNWERVVKWLTTYEPPGKTVFYQKHMSHHLLPNIGREWLTQLTHCFLIRDPREVITSLVKIYPQMTLVDTGLPQQWEIFEAVRRRTGQTPAVIDSKEVLNHPREVLSKLCAQLGVEFIEQMLSWPPGLRETDGIWAKHWYHEVEKTTSFRPYKPKPDEVPPSLQGVLSKGLPIYERMMEHRLRP